MSLLDPPPPRTVQIHASDAGRAPTAQRIAPGDDLEEEIDPNEMEGAQLYEFLARKYGSTLNSVNISLRRTAPDEHDFEVFPMAQVPTYGTLLARIRGGFDAGQWDGRPSTYRWTAMRRSARLGEGTINLARDDERAAEFRAERANRARLRNGDMQERAGVAAPPGAPAGDPAMRELWAALVTGQNQILAALSAKPAPAPEPQSGMRQVLETFQAMREMGLVGVSGPPAAPAAAPPAAPVDPLTAAIQKQIAKRAGVLIEGMLGAGSPAAPAEDDRPKDKDGNPLPKGMAVVNGKIVPLDKKGRVKLKGSMFDVAMLNSDGIMEGVWSVFDDGLSRYKEVAETFERTANNARTAAVEMRAVSEAQRQLTAGAGVAGAPAPQEAHEGSPPEAPRRRARYDQ